MDSSLLCAAESRFDLTERDIGELSSVKGSGMRFAVRTFDAENAGALCLMDMKAFFGLMKMWTVFFSPTERDGPILSADYIEAFGNCTLVLELYDTTLSHPGFQSLDAVKSKYASLPDYDNGEHWYNSLLLPVSIHKKARKRGEEMRQLIQEYAGEYYRLLADCPVCDAGEKKARNAEFADGLLQNGGPAVNQFKKMLGEDKTRTFIRNVMFCCE